MKITESLIKSYTDEHIFKRGASYYKTGKVTDFKVNMEQHNLKEKIYKIDAWVESSLGSDVHYNTSIQFNDVSGFNSFDCNCGMFNTDKKHKGICRHMVATLLKFMNEYQNGDSNIVAESKTSHMINDFKTSLMSSAAYKTPVNLEVKYCYHASEDVTSSIELYVGISKLYVVKDMRDFLEAIETGGSLEFGKGFTFNGSEHCFADIHQPLIDFMLEIYEFDKLNSRSSVPGTKTTRIVSGKKLYLLPRQLSRFFQLCKESSITASIFNTIYEGVRILNEDIPLCFDLKMVKDDIILILNESIARPLSSKGEYFFHKGTIYKPSKNQTKFYLPIYNSLIKVKTNYLSFSLKDMGQIASFILPGVKEISSQFNIAPELKSYFIEEPLKTKIYLDNFKGSVTAEVLYNYGDIRINPLACEATSFEDKHLLRDMSLEFQTESVLTNFGFSEDEHYYVLKDDNKLIEFLVSGLDTLQDITEIYCSETFKKIKVYTPDNYSSSISLNDENLLELTFNLEGIEDDELKFVFNSIRERKKYHRLTNGSFIDLTSENLNKLGSLMEYLDFDDKDIGESSVKLKKHNALYLENYIESLNSDFVKRDRDFLTLISELRNHTTREY